MTTAAAMLVITAVSAAVSAYSSYAQAKAQNAQIEDQYAQARAANEAANKAAEYNAQVQERNAQVAEMQAADAETRGRVNERRHRKDVLRFRSLQRTKLAAAGVDVDQGSALDVLDSTSFSGELDALMLRQNAAREAWGHRIQASDYQAQSQLHLLQKRPPGRRPRLHSPWLAAGTSLLSSTPSVLSSYQNWQQ